MVQQKTKKSEVKPASVVQAMVPQDFSDISQRDIDPVGFSIWIRQLLQNWRQGTVGSKGRSEVNFSNKKPWKQKGTGRARAGSARSPLWRKGGVIFGPQARVRKLSVSKSMKKNVLNNLFWQYLNQGKIVSFDWMLKDDKPKTTDAFKALKAAGLGNGKINIFLSAHDYLHYASFINIDNVRVVFFDESNAFDLASADQWIVLKKDVDAFKQMVSTWN